MIDADRRGFKTRFPWCTIRPFPFDRHPAHVRQLAACAWKPIVLDELMTPASGPIVWLDAATIIRGSLAPLCAWTVQHGVLALCGQSPLARWCHARTLELMQVPNDDRSKRCRAAGVVGLDPAKPDVRDLVACWRDAALNPELIAPSGANRAGHRYDQALLTILLYKFARERGLVLTDDEVDVSSLRPARWISTRNFVAPYVPTVLDPLVRAWFAVYKTLDRAIIRWRRRRRLKELTYSAERVLQRVLRAAFDRGATTRARAFLRGKSSIRGRKCQCDPSLPVHLVHSQGLREGSDVVIDYGANMEHPQRRQIPIDMLVEIAPEIAAGDIVHVKTDHIEKFVRLILPRTAGPVVLVTGDSATSPVRRFAHLLDDDRIIHWFAQHCDWAEDHPKLTRIPIGVDNPIFTKLEKRLGFLLMMALGKIPFDRTLSRNGMGDQALLQAVKRTVRPIRDKPPRVLCTFHRNQQFITNADTIPDRVEASHALRAQRDCYFVEKRLKQAEYWRIHDEFAFEVSPRGKGLDCFRTWECLFLDTIPIVKTSPLDALYRQEGFPVVVVQSFHEVTTENLRRWKAEIEGRFTDQMRRKLSNDYWLERIRGVKERYLASSYRPGYRYTERR
ncbi:MAG: hypothetical protein A3G76_00465 [Acidobacteria bacterium RIFCSPLOWO2_12_FULL_65_11]|nr:MAG: hypothetical protein A3H95_06540 [Acidobacteria bacterium RIFCSPLOWO2_02_FULL_64_15]OFW34123.1 MAG: hypothetical protein A3G76_00465 [Acidobacteria bacterium RIFCSPLOWO2_12_FULL_65_11]